jgi:hypothetical protein
MTTVLLAINSSTWQATPGPLKASSAKQRPDSPHNTLNPALVGTLEQVAQTP